MAPLDDEELGSVLEALLLVVDTPVTVEALGCGHRAARLPGRREAAGDGRRTHRARQRHRPAEDRRGLADVHPRPVRAVRGEAAAGRRAIQTHPGRAGNAGRGGLPPARDARAGERGSRRQCRCRHAHPAGARPDHRGRRRRGQRRGDIRHHGAVPRALGIDVAGRPSRYRAAASRRRHASRT